VERIKGVCTGEAKSLFYETDAKPAFIKVKEIHNATTYKKELRFKLAGSLNKD
jgi:hypothetical protein